MCGVCNYRGSMSSALRAGGAPGNEEELIDSIVLDCNAFLTDFSLQFTFKCVICLFILLYMVT